MPNLFGIDVAGILNDAMGEQLLDATLVKVSNGSRASIAEGYAEVLTNYLCRGVISKYVEEQVDGTLVMVEDRKILLLGRSISSDDSIEPVPGDKIIIEGETYRITGDGEAGLGVTRDPAAASYVAHCRLTTDTLIEGTTADLFGIGMADMVNDAMGDGLLDATLTRITPGTRDSISEAPGEITTTYECKGVISRYNEKQTDGTMIQVGDRRILLLSKSISTDNSVEPLPGDKITIEGGTYRIVGDGDGGLGVKRDPAAATYVAHCRETTAGPFIWQSVVDISATAQVVAAVTMVAQMTASISASAEASVNATTATVQQATAAIAASATAAADATRTQQITLGVTADAAVVAGVTLTSQLAASIAADAQVVAAAVLTSQLTAAVSASAETALDATRIQQLTAAIAASASAAVDAIVTTTAQATASITADAQVVAAATLTSQLAAAVAANAQVVAAATLTSQLTASIAASATAAVDATIASTTMQATASIAATALATAAVTLTSQADAAIAASASASVDATRTQRLTASVLADATLGVEALRKQLATAAISATALSTALATLTSQAVAAASATATATALATARLPAAAAVTADATLVAAATLTSQLTAAVAASAAASVDATFGSATYQLTAAVTADATVVAGTDHTATADAAVNCSATLAVDATKIAGLTAIWEADWTPAPEQLIHSTASAVAAANSAGASPSNIWITDGTGTVTDDVGSENMTETGTVIRQGIASGLHGATSAIEHESAEIRDGNSLRTASHTAFALNNDLAFCFPYRASFELTSSQLFGTRSGSGSDEGIWLVVIGSKMYVGVFNSSGSGKWDWVTPISNGAWEFVVITWDSSAKLLSMYTTSNQTGVTATMTGSFTNDLSAVTRIGGGGTYDSADVQIPFLYAFTGTEAAKITSYADAEGLFPFGSDETGLLSTAEHNGTITAEVGHDATDGTYICHYRGDGNHGRDQVPWTLIDDISDSGIVCQDSVTNLLDWSQKFDLWTPKSGYTMTAWDFQGPSGMQNAFKYVATSATTYVGDSVSLTSGITYYLSVYARAVTGTETSRLAFYNAANTTEQAGADISLTTAWKRYELAYTAGSTATYVPQIQAGVRGSAAGEEIYMSNSMLATTPNAPWVWTDGASASMTGTDYRYASAPFDLDTEGMVRAKFACFNDDEGAARFVWRRGGGNDSIYARLDAAENMDVGLTDSSATLHEATSSFSSLDLTTLIDFWSRWHVTSGGISDAATTGEAVDIVRAATSQDSNGTPVITVGTGAADFHFGQSSSSANQINGMLKSITVYEDEADIGDLPA